MYHCPLGQLLCRWWLNSSSLESQSKEQSSVLRAPSLLQHEKLWAPQRGERAAPGPRAAQSVFSSAGSSADHVLCFTEEPHMSRLPPGRPASPPRCAPGRPCPPRWKPGSELTMNKGSKLRLSACPSDVPVLESHMCRCVQ